MQTFAEDDQRKGLWMSKLGEYLQDRMGGTGRRKGMKG